MVLKKTNGLGKEQKQLRSILIVLKLYRLFGEGEI